MLRHREPQVENKHGASRFIQEPTPNNAPHGARTTTNPTIGNAPNMLGSVRRRTLYANLIVVAALADCGVWCGSACDGLSDLIRWERSYRIYEILSDRSDLIRFARPDIRVYHASEHCTNETTSIAWNRCLRAKGV